MIQSLKSAWVVSEDVAVGVVSEVFSELHEAFRVVEHAAREGEGTGCHRGETVGVVQRMVITFDEPWLNLCVGNAVSRCTYR